RQSRNQEILTQRRKGAKSNRANPLFSFAPLRLCVNLKNGRVLEGFSRLVVQRKARGIQFFLLCDLCASAVKHEFQFGFVLPALMIEKAQALQCLGFCLSVYALCDCVLNSRSSTSSPP